MIVSFIDNNDKILTFDNKNLSNLKINFLKKDPYIFLKNLFTPFHKDYFREIIYHLSKKIDGYSLYNSTISDIDFFIYKINNEENSEPPTI